MLRRVLKLRRITVMGQHFLVGGIGGLFLLLALLVSLTNLVVAFVSLDLENATKLISIPLMMGFAVIGLIVGAWEQSKLPDEQKPYWWGRSKGE